MAYNLAERQSVTVPGERKLHLYCQVVSGNYFDVQGVRPPTFNYRDLYPRWLNYLGQD